MDTYQEWSAKANKYIYSAANWWNMVKLISEGDTHNYTDWLIIIHGNKQYAQYEDLQYRVTII